MPMLRLLGDEKARGSLTNVAMKILREDRSLSCSAETNSLFSANVTTNNVLVHGDNREALKALLPFYAGRVRCIFVDPPYNTGSAFEHDDDILELSLREQLSIANRRAILPAAFVGSVHRCHSACPIRIKSEPAMSLFYSDNVARSGMGFVTFSGEAASRRSP